MKDKCQALKTTLTDIPKETRNVEAIHISKYICSLQLRKTAKESMEAHHQDGTDHHQNEAARFSLGNYLEISLKMNLYHYVKK